MFVLLNLSVEELKVLFLVFDELLFKLIEYPKITTNNKNGRKLVMKLG